MTNILTGYLRKRELFLAATGVIMLSVGFAYADEFRMPFSPDNLVDHWVEVVITPDEMGGADVLVTQSSLFHFDNTFDVPTTIVDQTADITGGITETKVIQLKELVEQALLIAPEPEPEPESRLTPEIQAALDAKTAEQEKVIEDALHCILGIEGSSLFTEYRDRLVLEKMVYFKSLPLGGQERQIILWTEECEKWSESYISDFAQYDDIFRAEQLEQSRPTTLDTTNSPYTDPVTAKDIAKEEQEARASIKHYNDPYKEMPGINRGGQPEGAKCLTQMGKTMCPLVSQAELLNQAVTDQQNYDRIQQLVCDSYLNDYQALVERIIAGDKDAELPKWLNHCDLE